MLQKRDAPSLDVEDSGPAGDGRAPVVLLHGLTATRRYVLHGSRLLAREGFRVIAYDARGHGRSGPAPEPGAYEYADLAGDLVAVLEERDVAGTVLVGHSMGAATAVRVALERPDLVSGLVQITPAYAGDPYSDDEALAYWDRLAAGLAADGVDGFMRAFDAPKEPRWREPVLKFTRRRIERHRNPDALAEALRVVSRSEAFDGLGRLADVELPTLVVGSRDDADAAHPLAVAQEYARRLPVAELVVEDAGDPPLAWQGAQLSRAIRDWLERVAG